MGYTDRREVKQFQYTAWPDHGVPDYPGPFLQFLRRITAMNPPDAGAMITHCSAGVGRTGAFIVIDSMLERIKHEKTIDVYGKQFFSKMYDNDPRYTQARYKKSSLRNLIEKAI